MIIMNVKIIIITIPYVLILLIPNSRKILSSHSLFITIMSKIWI